MGRFDRNSGRSNERPTLHRAVCDDCGKDCEVPFRPSGNKPVYCSRCFEKQEGNDYSSPRGRDSGRSRDSRGGDRSMYKGVCDDCGRTCEVPFRPSGDKPLYCSKCFENVDPKREGGKSEDLSALKSELSEINVKLEAILKVLTPREVRVVRAVKEKKVKKKT